MEIPFIKCHGSGNDFILIDEVSRDFGFTEKQRKDLSVLLCDREHGIGSDGILFVMPSKRAEARMRMFNSDGSEAEMCGNGLRCVARFMIEQLGHHQISIETEKAVLDVSQVEEIFEGIDTFAVMIEPISFDVSSLPMVFDSQEAKQVVIPELTEDYTFTGLSVPNPHIVSIVERINEEDLSAVGKRANLLPDVFPKGVNVSFVQILDTNKIFVQTYERGVGLTNACGTAMSASTLVSVLYGPNDWNTPVIVLNKGGLVNCVAETFKGESKIQLRGNATNVYRASIQLDWNTRSYHVNGIRYFEEENEKYHQLEQYAASHVKGG